MYLLVLVLDDVSHLNDVLQAWQGAGVRGVTILDSTGLNRILKRHRPQAAYARFSQIAGTIHASHNTLFAVIDDLAVAEAAAGATQAVIGSLLEPDTGIMFALPLAQVWGMNIPKASDGDGQIK
jgi:nitrogen regulatory protein P-II 1